MGSWQISLPPLPYAPGLVDSEVSAASPREAEQSRIFSLRPLCLWAHHKLQHQEAAVGWPLHIGNLGWGHWPVLTEGGMAFLFYSNVHGRHIHKTLCRSHQEVGALVASLYIALLLCPADFLPLLLPWKNDCQPFLKVSSLPPICSNLPSICQASHHHERRHSLHTKAQTVLVSIWARLGSWHQTSPSSDFLLAITDSLLLPLSNHSNCWLPSP